MKSQAVITLHYSYKVKSLFTERPLSAHFDSLNHDFTLNRDFFTLNSFSVTRFCTFHRDFTLSRHACKMGGLLTRGHSTYFGGYQD